MAHAYEYAINRYYTPQAASFLSADPLVAQTQEPHAFTGGDPLNLTDPLGLEWFWTGTADVAGLGAESLGGYELQNSC